MAVPRCRSNTQMFSSWLLTITFATSRPSGDRLPVPQCSTGSVTIAVAPPFLRSPHASVERLERDIAMESGVVGAIDRAHSALAERSEDFKCAESGTRLKRHGQGRPSLAHERPIVKNFCRDLRTIAHRPRRARGSRGMAPTRSRRQALRNRVVLRAARSAASPCDRRPSASAGPRDRTRSLSNPARPSRRAPRPGRSRWDRETPAPPLTRAACASRRLCRENLHPAVEILNCVVASIIWSLLS